MIDVLILREEYCDSDIVQYWIVYVSKSKQFKASFQDWRVYYKLWRVSTNIQVWSQLSRLKEDCYSKRIDIPSTWLPLKIPNKLLNVNKMLQSKDITGWFNSNKYTKLSYKMPKIYTIKIDGSNKKFKFCLQVSQMITKNSFMEEIQFVSMKIDSYIYESYV